MPKKSQRFVLGFRSIRVWCPNGWMDAKMDNACQLTEDVLDQIDFRQIVQDRLNEVCPGLTVTISDE